MKTGFAFKSSIILLALYIVFGLLQAPSYLKVDPQASLSESLASVFIFSGILLPCAYWGARIEPEGLPILANFLEQRKTGMKPVVKTILFGLGFAVLAFAANVIITFLFQEFWLAPTTQDYVLKFSLLDKLTTSISSGIWEETIFRLFLIGALSSLFRTRIGGVLVANGIFTYMHVIFQDPPYNLPALIIVFIIGLVYSRCFLERGLGSAITCHAGMNLLSMLLAPAI